MSDPDLQSGRLILARESLAAALEAWPTAALLVDGSGTVCWANGAAGSLFGFEAEHLIGTAWEDRPPGLHIAHGAARPVPFEAALPFEDGGKLLLFCEDLSLLRGRVAQLSVLVEISSILHSTTDLDKVLRVILTGVTSGKGLRFNRAFLMLVDEKKGILEGRMGVGPSDPSDAHRIWSELAREDLPLQELLLRSAVHKASDVRAQEIVEALTVPLDSYDDILIDVLHGQHAVCGREVPEGSEDLRGLLGSDAFCLVPIKTWGRPIGVLLADNVVTGEAASPEDRESLWAFANQAGIAIEKAYLYDELQKKVKELEETRNILIENQHRLLEAERLKALGEVIARVAHEIRNPLVAVGGYAMRIIRRKTEGDEDLEDLQVILEETERLETILQELLDYANPPSSPRTRLCRIEEIVERTARVAVETLNRHDVRLEMSLSEGLPDVQADPLRIRQLLLNLVRNAGEAAPEGGAVTLRAAVRDDCMEIEVADTGPGVPLEDRERIFRPFYTTKPDGSGLGLAVARRIAEEHGGSLECRTGRGGRFVLCLPLPGHQEDGEDGTT